MKHTPKRKWAAWLGMIAVLAAWPLSAMAQVGTPIIVNGTNYTSTSGTVISTIANSVAGSPINVSNGGTAIIANADVSSAGFQAFGVYANVAYLSGSNIKSTTTGAASHAVYLQGSGTLLLSGGTFTTSGSSAYGLACDGGASLLVADKVFVTTTGMNAIGIFSGLWDNTVVTSSTVNTTGYMAHGVAVGTSTMSMANMVINTTGSSAIGVVATSRVFGGVPSLGVFTGSNVIVTTEGASAHGVSADNCAQVTLYDGSVTVGGVGADVYAVVNSGTITANNVTGNSVQGHGIAVVPVAPFSPNSNLDGINTVIVNGGSITAGQDLVNVESSESANIVLNGVITSNGTNVFNANGSGTTSLTANSTDLTGNVVANDTTVNTLNLDDSTLTGKSVMADSAVTNLSLANNSQWTMTDSSVLTNLTMNNGKVTFKHDSDTSFKTLLVKGDLSGGNGDQIDMTTNLGIRKGDLLVVRGSDGGSYTLNISNVGSGPQGPNEALRVVSTRDGGANFTLTGNQYRDAGMYRYHFMKDGSQWWLVNGDGSGANGGGGADDTTNGGYGGTTGGNGSQDDGMGGNGSNQGTVPGGTNGEGYAQYSGSANNDPYVPSGSTTPPTPPTPPVPPAPPTPSGNDLSDLAHDILNSTGAQAIAQFNGLDNMNSHFNALRSGFNGSGLNGWMIDEAKRDINIWVQSYGSQYNISGNYGGRNFSNMVYGVDVGADKAYQIDKNNLLVVGVFAGYGQTDADFHHQGSDANSESYGGGVYATWLEQSGWFADLTLRGAYIDGSFDSYNEQYQKSSGSYNNMAASAALNLGKRFTFQDAWYAEPSVGAAYVYLTGYDYNTGGASDVAVSVTDANVFRFKFGSAFGRTINFNGKSWLQPYVKVFGIEQCSDGGKVQSSGSEWRPAMDGLAAQLGCGIVWQLNEDNQLHLDYDAEFGQNYDKPFGITAGFRHQF